MLEIGKQSCRSVINTRTFYINQNNAITSLKVNSSSIIPKTFSGKINVDGSCQGKSYSDLYGSWDNVIVSGYVEISLKEFTTPITLIDNELILPSGVRCEYHKPYCLDSDSSNTYWDLAFYNDCSPYSLDVLYQGDAYVINDISSISSSSESRTFFVEKEKTLFALRTTKNFSLCGISVYQTEHPKLIIIESLTQDFFTGKDI